MQQNLRLRGYPSRMPKKLGGFFQHKTFVHQNCMAMRHSAEFQNNASVNPILKIAYFL
jgi:hypothetical protein